MSKRKRKAQAGRQDRRRAATSTPKEDAPPLGPETSPPNEPARDVPRRWLLAAAMVLFVARPLFPSDSVAEKGQGTVLVMLSLLLLAGWGINMLRSRRGALHFGPTDVAVLVLLVFYGVSAMVAVAGANAREALNVLWAWIGLGVGFFLLRQLVRRLGEARAVVAVMIGLAVALSTYGLYQCVYDLPRLRSDYARDPDGMLQAEDLWYAPGSTEREQFENRLESREPFATFALTNSLAGYLAPWLVVAVGLVVLNGVPWPRLVPARRDVSRHKEHAHASESMPPDAPPSTAGQASSGTQRTWVGVGLSATLIAACLILTKSRSAYAAALLGLGLVAMMRWHQRRAIGWKLPVTVAVVAAVLVAGAVVVGGLDAEVFSEAGKSLGYRVQYWRSTLAMIKDHPWLGCGPGQFQNRYTAYKLPEASEEVANPHNFLLEVWATAGTGAALALLAVLACFGWAAWKWVHWSSENVFEKGATAGRSSSAGDKSRPTTRADKPPMAPSSTASPARPNESEEEGDDASRWVYGGALVGFLAAWPLGALGTTAPGPAMLLIGLPLGAATVFLLGDWVKGGRLAVALVSIGLVVLLTNLLAAGGIGLPGVAGTLWLLLALGLLVTEDRRREPSPRAVAWTVTILAAVLAAVCYWTAYRPVLSAQGHTVAAMSQLREVHTHLREARTHPREAPTHLREARTHLREARTHLLAAAEADPLWADPWKQLALLALDDWRDDHRRESLDQFVRYARRVTELDPESDPSWNALGNQYLEVYQHTSSKDHLEAALAAYRRAIELYSNNAEYHGRLALTLQLAGREAAARREAETALRLDDSMPHLDKKLSPKLRRRLLRIGS